VDVSIWAASYRTPGHVPPPLDFQSVNFGGSLTSQTVDDSCGFLFIERFLVISTRFHFSHVNIYTNSFVTDFCILYANFVIGTWSSTSQLWSKIFLPENMCIKINNRPEFYMIFVRKHILPFFLGGGVNAPCPRLLRLWILCHHPCSFAGLYFLWLRSPSHPAPNPGDAMDVSPRVHSF